MQILALRTVQPQRKQKSSTQINLKASEKYSYLTATPPVVHYWQGICVRGGKLALQVKAVMLLSLRKILGKSHYMINFSFLFVQNEVKNLHSHETHTIVSFSHPCPYGTTSLDPKHFLMSEGKCLIITLSIW